ncbi:MAG: hypothetical protein K6G07_00430 [Lachnospiraceae bacterium]|nr:hypothetical protein [Lachnospiraceae bacterium]
MDGDDVIALDQGDPSKSGNYLLLDASGVDESKINEYVKGLLKSYGFKVLE